MRGVRSVVAVGIVGLAFWFAPAAQAACHAFTFADDTPTSVSEGSSVRITIERDAAVAPSSVRVRTVDKTARSGSDYNAFDQRIQYTGDELEKTVTIATREDSTDEPAETFQIALSEGQGCEVNQNFTYDDPHSMRITDDDAAPATTVKPTVKPQPRTTSAATTSSPTPTPSPTPTGSASPTPSPSPSPTSTFSPLAVDEDDGGFPWLPVLAVTGFLAAAGGALALTRLRRGGV